MTDQEIIGYYSNLLTIQYHGKPRAVATIQALAKAGIVNQLAIKVRDAFTLGTAVGAQLDIIGKYAGVTRFGYNFSGPVTLNDADFTTFIKLVIAQNSSRSDLASIQNILHIFFNGVIFLYDQGDMRFSYLMNSNMINQNLAQFLIKSGKLPKPMGVQIGSVLYGPNLGLNPLFGFRTMVKANVGNVGYSTMTNLRSASILVMGDAIL